MTSERWKGHFLTLREALTAWLMVAALLLTLGCQQGPGAEPVGAPRAGDDTDCRNAPSLLQTDPARAVAACRRLAAQGFADARYNLGLMYHNGDGVPQDDAEAVKWYRLAADQGDAAAQANLGFMYGDGRGVPQDDVQAYMWFDLAAARFAASETEKRDFVAKSRDEVASKLTPAQIAEAQRLAREWKPQ